MSDPIYLMRAGESGVPIKGTPGNVLAIGADGESVRPVPGGAGMVSSVFGRIGAVVAVLGDYAASLISNDSGVAGATVADALDTLEAEVSALVVGVSSVFGRSGAVAAQLNDYTSDLIGNDSGVAGATVSDALDTLAAGGSGPALANFVFNPSTDFPANSVTQVDCVPLTTAPAGDPTNGAVADWFGNSPDPALIVVGAQVDGAGTGMRIFVLNYTGSAVNGISNVLFTVTYPRAP